MNHEMGRRGFLGVAAGTVLAARNAGAADAAGPAAGTKARVIAISCSPRKGKTTAAALQVCLDAIRAANPQIETELVDLAGLSIPVFNPASPGGGDFAGLAAKIAAPDVKALVIGTPVYFGNMSSLCKTLLDHWIVFRKNNFALRNRIAGVVAVGGVRNGGQELTVASVHAALLAQDMIVVGDGRPTAHLGATVLNDGKDSIAGDEFGLSTLKNLGARIAEVIAMRPS